MEQILHAKTKRFVASVDVKQMFPSVRLKKESDMDMLRYLWAPPGSSRPTMYRFKGLPFGILCSPYLAMWCLHETAKKMKEAYPKAAEIILNKTYMDDILIVGDTITETTKLVHDVLAILKEGGFTGHKITANDKRILESVQKDQTDQSRVVSLLGLKLDQETNQFQFDLDDKFTQFDPEAKKITRRHIVSLASQVFDTQGYV